MAVVFGLDIGRSFIKVVQLKISGSRKVLTNAGSLQTPGGGIQTESRVDLDKVSEAVKAVRNMAKIGARACCVSIVESQVVTRLIQMPNLTDKELSSAIHWEAEQYIPLPLKDVNLQYRVISRPAKGTAEKMKVLLIAVPKRVIAKYMDIVKEAGLAIHAMETESAALARALCGSSDPATIIVSLGAVSTELVIAYEGNVLFTRSIATGGTSLTRSIMAEFNLPASQAEEYKQAYGILEDKLSGKVAAVLRPILEILVSEILKAVEFARSHVGSQIVRIVICGGGAYLPGLAEFLVSRTSLEVSLGDPWGGLAKEGLILKLPGQGSFYAVATGLALRT